MNPFISPAEPLLRAEPSLTDDQRADLFDHFVQSATADELAERIASLPVPQELKAKLYDAHRQQSEPTNPVDRVVASLNRLRDIHPDALQAAEKHPAVLRGIIDATKG